MLVKGGFTMRAFTERATGPRRMAEERRPKVPRAERRKPPDLRRAVGSEAEEHDQRDPEDYEPAGDAGRVVEDFIPFHWVSPVGEGWAVSRPAGCYSANACRNSRRTRIARTIAASAASVASGRGSCRVTSMTLRGFSRSNTWSV